MGPASRWLPSAPTQTDLRGELDLGLGPRSCLPCRCTVSAFEPNAGSARGSLGTTSCANEGLLACFPAKSLRCS
eukprot:16433371-Heterocapsa_arctica.AAC.1